MSKSRLLAEIIGWYGALAIIAAYGLVSFGIIQAEGYTFQLLNLTGSIGIIVISLVKNVKQAVILNIFAASIAITALARLVF